MAKEQLRDYPIEVDPSLDFEATRKYFGRGSCIISIEEIKLNSGEVLVCLYQQREGEKVVNTPMGFRRVCEHGLIVSGYRVEPEGLFKRFKAPKIRRIPNEEVQGVRSELLELLERENRKPEYIEF